MRVGLLTMSDGRDFVHRHIESFARDSEERIAAALRTAGHDVIRAGALLWTNELASAEARRVADSRPDLTIFNYPVWAFPHFTMLAAGGALDQIGRVHGRIWGEISDASVLAAVLVHVRAGHAVQALRGQTFGRFGGRPMGMYTAVANTDQWMAKFGVDVEEIDQWEIVRRAEQVPASRARAGREWLEKRATVHYDGRALTAELLERQDRS